MRIFWTVSLEAISSQILLRYNIYCYLSKLINNKKEIKKGVKGVPKKELKFIVFVMSLAKNPDNNTCI